MTSLSDAYARAVAAKDDLGFPETDTDDDVHEVDGNRAEERRPVRVSTGPERYASRFVRGFDPATLRTADECCAALAELDQELALIRGQVEAWTDGICDRPDAWAYRAKLALKAKSSTRASIEARRRALERREARPEKLGTAAYEPLPPSAFPADYDPGALATVDECADAMAGLAEELVDRRRRVAEARHAFYAHGLAATGGWLAGAEAEVRRLGSLRQRIQDRRGALARAKRDAERESWTERFVAAARLRLDPTLFAELCRMAEVSS